MIQILYDLHTLFKTNFNFYMVLYGKKFISLTYLDYRSKVLERV